jgi:hypothetical protein
MKEYVLVHIAETETECDENLSRKPDIMLRSTVHVHRTATVSQGFAFAKKFNLEKKFCIVSS